MDDEKKNYQQEEMYSNAVRAGKRTYFFDVKATRGNDLYLTITESKKKMRDDGEPFYEKHKLFLYKEDFDKFADGLKDALGEIERIKSTDDKYADSENEGSTSDMSYDNL